MCPQQRDNPVDALFSASYVDSGRQETLEEAI